MKNWSQIKWIHAFNQWKIEVSAQDKFQILPVFTRTVLKDTWRLELFALFRPKQTKFELSFGRVVMAQVVELSKTANFELWSKVMGSIHIYVHYKYNMQYQEGEFYPFFILSCLFFLTFSQCDAVVARVSEWDERTCVKTQRWPSKPRKESILNVYW